MTTNFDESYKYCILKWIDWMFYIWLKVRDLFSHRKHFFLRKLWYWSWWHIKKRLGFFFTRKWTQLILKSILYDLHSTFKFTQRRAKLKYAFIGKVAKKARIFFMYCFSVRFEFFQETSIHRKSRGQARIIVMYVYKNSPIFLLFYWFRYRFYRGFFCISINLMLQKTK